MDADLTLSDLRERVAELTAENARLRAELDHAQGVWQTILTISAFSEQAMQQCRGEEPGTILRETDGLRREWLLGDDQQWHVR